MKTIKLDKLDHRGEAIVLIQFPFDPELCARVRKIKNIRWSKSLKSWYVTYSTSIQEEIDSVFRPIATLEASALVAKIEKEKQVPAGLHDLSPDVSEQVRRFKHWMFSKRYSENTIGTYTDALRSFLRFNCEKRLTEISNEDVIKYNNEFILKNNLSASYQNQVVNAVKLFFRTIQNVSIDVELVHRPKRAKVLPNVLSKEEVKAILDAPKFLKHKAMLSLIYSCGLRCGELLRLKPEHIDADRNILIIKQSKGKKDRIAPLSDKTIALLRAYYKVFKPQIYLFEGEKAGNPYDDRSLQQVLKQSIKKAGINKPVTLHWLRHSYATHLLENGTDLRYIQEILGHSSSKTTEIYTHVSTKSIQKIVSPFDSL